MTHLPALIHDLALILITGAISTLIFRKLKQPLVLGYIIAGFFVGPHFHLIPTVADEKNIETLAEIGVIFLLFSLGLEFSFKKLMRVGGMATITAFVEIAFITVAGFYSGRLMGWSTMDSLFLGGMLASSSTTIIIRAFDELGMKTKQFARIVFGVLVVEDIVVIVLMVLLSTVAATQEFAGTEIVFTILKLSFFLVIWFLAGIFILPTLLNKTKKLQDGETLLILSLGLCLGMVVLATESGFSAELGAFIMGSIIAETTSAEKVEELIKPVKDLFGAVFFVSVGMLIDPQAIMEYGIPVIIITLLTIFGKLFSTTAGALLSGQPLRQSVQVGMSMAQIGEFAFIVATLGMSLGVISSFLFPVAVGVSAITTFTTPYMIRLSDPFYRFLEKRLPKKWIQRLNRYSMSTQTIQAENDWKKIIRHYIRIIFTNMIILIALMILSVKLLQPWIAVNIANQILGLLLVVFISFAVAAPFFLGLMRSQPGDLSFREMWLKKNYNKGPLLLIEIVRLMVGIFITGFWLYLITKNSLVMLALVPAILAIFYLFKKRIENLYQRIELSFLGNFNAREKAHENLLSENVKRKNEEIQVSLEPWDAHIVALEVPPHTDYAGKTLFELKWREQYGINVVYIKRGENLINIPQRHHMLLPYDRIGILATDAQLQEFLPVFESVADNIFLQDKLDSIVLDKMMVNEYTRLKGQTIRGSGIREFTGGLVIGIERGNQRILNPDSETQFEWDDVIWIVGDRRKIAELKKS